MERFEFFNKQDVTSGDMNLAILKIDEQIKNLLKGQWSAGFFEASSAETGFNFSIILPQFTQGSRGIDYINIPTSNSIIMGLDKAGNLIRIIKDEIWQNTNTTQNSGNINIPINTNNLPQPYTKYIWIAYREITNNTIQRIDYDGSIHKPIKSNGYEIVISDLDPTAYSHPTGLYIGKVIVNNDTQTYDYSGSISPFYLGMLKGGIFQKNVRIFPNTSTPTQWYDYSSTEPDKQLTLQDHINALGDGILSAKNPHKLDAHNINALDINTLNKQNILKNGFLRNIEFNPGFLLRNAAKIYNSTTENYVYGESYELYPTYPIFYNGKIYYWGDTRFKDVDGKIKVYFTSDDSEGWYYIYLTLENSTDTFLTYKKSQNISDENIIRIGQVYWKNSGGIKELRVTENYAGTPNGTLIYLLSDIGNINIDNLYIDKNNHSVITNKNLIPNGNFKYGLYQTDTYEYNNCIDTTYYTGSSLSVINYGSDKVLKLYNLANGRKLRLKIKNGRIGATAFFSFTSMVSFSSNCYVKVTPSDGAAGYSIYPFNSNQLRTYVLDFFITNDQIAFIDFEFYGSFGPSDYMLLDDLQVMTGTFYQKELLYNFTASEIYLDKNYAANEKRTQIYNMSLERILNYMSYNSELLKVNKLGNNSFDDNNFISRGINVNTDISNLEVKFILSYLVYINQISRYGQYFEFDRSKYDFVWANFSHCYEIMSTDTGERSVIYIKDIYVGGNSLFIHIETDKMSQSGANPDSLPIFGIVILKRKAE